MNFKETIDEESFYRRVFKKTESPDSVTQAKAAVSNLKHYCKNVHNEDIQTVLLELKKENSVGVLFNFLNDFVEWLERDHPDVFWKRHPHQKIPSILEKKCPSAVRNYISVIKKFLKLCYGIRADEDDWKTELALPLMEDSNPDPISPEELRKILDNTPNVVRKTMTMVGKDTGFRLLELLKMKKEHIDFTKDPVEITLPNKLMKGKRGGRTAYVANETKGRLKLLYDSLQEGQYVFHNNDPIRERVAFHAWWNSLVTNKCGFTEKYENGRLKKNFHSVRAFCATQYSEPSKHSSDDGHGYIGHKDYLAQYIRLPDGKKIQMFKNAEPYLSVYERTIVVKPTKEEMIQEVMNDPAVISAIGMATKTRVNENTVTQEMINNAVAAEFKKLKLSNSTLVV